MINLLLFILSLQFMLYKSFPLNNNPHFFNPEKFRSIEKNSLENVINLVKQEKAYCYLSTINYSNKLLDFPHTSIVGFSVDDKGYPILAMSDISQHTKNIKKNDKVSILVQTIGLKDQTGKRTGLTGIIKKVEDDEIDKYKKIYKQYHKNAFWIDFPDFKFYKLELIKDIYYIGGFGRATKISVNKYHDYFI